MGFQQLNLKFYYDNDQDDLINDFYIPVMSIAKKYKRSTGFFSSSSFWNIIDGLKLFIERDGQIQLIVSPNLSEKDIEAINLGEKAKEDTLESFIISNILNEEKYEDQFNLLSWLILKNKLEIKFVIKKNLDRYGIFHDKSAIIYDEENTKIAYHGSMNESEAAYVDNFEAIDVFMEWNDSDKIRIDKLEKTFDRIWNNNSDNWASFSIPDSIKQKIIKKGHLNNSFVKRYNTFRITDDYKLRNYQQQAISEWMKNGFKGILEMATGSGKTYTSIFALYKLINLVKRKGFSCGVLIVVPYKNLLEQWCKELEKFNVSPIKCYQAKYKWNYQLKSMITDFNKGLLENIFIITTNRTFCMEEFQKNLKNIKRDYIFCVDEMHHLLAPKISTLLPNNTEFRLGLTATLFNEYEKEKADQILNYFNKIVFNFSLKEAIENNCLTRYYYYPVFIDLNEDERKDYFELTKKLSRLINSKHDNQEIKEAIINQRRKIILNANNKISKFSTMKDELKKFNKTLVYCGDKIDEDGKFINKINRMIYNMGIKTHTYSSELSDIQRQVVLNKFQNGDLNVLTAIKCLDEGVDIPALECAFILASNMDSKQFIQRRGRILRKAPNKNYAYIYDFVVVPTLEKELIERLKDDEKKTEKRIVGSELKRVFEFAYLAENTGDIIGKITDILELYS